MSWSRVWAASAGRVNRTTGVRDSGGADPPQQRTTAEVMGGLGLTGWHRHPGAAAQKSKVVERMNSRGICIESKPGVPSVAARIGTRLSLARAFLTLS